MSTQDPDGTIHIEDEEATGAVKTGHMRWVLGISLLLAIVAMSIVWIVPALTSNNEVDATSRVGDVPGEAE
ncbi:hypothetical protein WAB17_08675 [Parerythrobacter aurantius]|uniref:hypothetical protein n=1 Tax=Parerythrobacter aurantius TaxID=3127706 RepID=UPI003243BE50